MTSVHRILVLVFLCAALFIQTLRAQPPDSGPALGVARLSLAKGDVTIQRGEAGDSIQAQANMPLVEGDILTTGLASRAEIQLDYSNLLRLNEHSEVKVASLGDQTFRLQVGRGIVTYSELRGGEADVDIETPLAAVRPEKNGRYRVEVVSVNEVIVTVQKGRAEVASANGRDRLHKGRRMIIRGTDQGIEFQVAKAGPADRWDHWNVRRDRQLRGSKAYRYVSQSIYGVEDLDGYGRWVYVPRYGHCWFPTVTASWAPYRYGRWGWLDHYGWSWMSADPWGWAPYHYGRWFYRAHLGWGWHPGSYHSHYYWEPALVAFFGWGSHSGLPVGVGLHFGAYGWIPLAPGEPYYPWYGHLYGGYFGPGYGGYRNRIRVDNSINIYNNYQNARHRHGTTLVNAQDFSRGQIVNARSLQSSELRRASLMRGRLPVVPDRASQGRLIRRTGSLAQGDGSTYHKGFYSTGQSRRSVTRNSFSRQRQEIANLVRSHGQANHPADPRANPGSSTNSKAIRSAADPRLQRGTSARSASKSSSRSSPSLSSSDARPGRTSIDRNPSGRRRQATDRSLTNNTPSRASTPDAARSRSNASRPGRSSSSLEPGSRSRDNISSRTRSSSSGSPSYVPRSSSRRKNRISTSPSRRSQNSSAGNTRLRSQTTRSTQRNSTTRQRSSSRPTTSRAQSNVRSSPSIAPRSSSRAKINTRTRGSSSRSPSYVPRSSSRRKNRISTSPSRRSQNSRTGSIRSRSQTRGSNQRDFSTSRRSSSRSSPPRSQSKAPSSPSYPIPSSGTSRSSSSQSSPRVSASSPSRSGSESRSRASRSSSSSRSRSGRR